MRTCFEKVDKMNKCHLYLWLCNRWLNYRMQLLSAVTSGLVGLAVLMVVLLIAIKVYKKTRTNN